MNVEELITGQDVVTARIDQCLGDVADAMAQHRVTGVPIVDEWGGLAGLVTVSGLMDLARDEGQTADLPAEPGWSPSPPRTRASGEWRQRSARDAMVTDLVTVTTATGVRDAARALLNAEVHRAVVLGSDRNVAGVVSALDFTRLVAESDAL